MAARGTKRKADIASPKRAVSKRAPAGKREARSAERRDAILAAALEEFATNGFAGTRLDDIAKRANVAKGTIYLYFADKETLFQELLRAMFAPIVAALREHSAKATCRRAISSSR